MERRTIIAALVLAALAPTVAAAIDPFEEGVAMSYWGRSNVIARPSGYYHSTQGRAVEHECDGLSGSGPEGSGVQLMTPDEARALAAVLEQAADAAEAP